MHTQQQLTISIQKTIKKSLMVLLITTAMSISGFFSVYHSRRFDAMPAGSFIQLFLIALLCGFQLFLVARFIQFLKLLIDKKPIAILNHQGIWLKHYGLIPWNNVLAIEEYRIHKSVRASRNMWGLGIRLKDINPVMAQTSWMRKKLLKWSQRSGLYDIVLSNIDIEHKEVIRFAQPFMGIHN